MGDIERIKKEKKFWEKIANKYDNQTGIKDRVMYKDLIEKIKNELNGQENVLEVACGTGIIALEIAKFSKKVIGIDISEKMIQIANSKLQKEEIYNVEFKIGDGYNINFKNNSFDIVLLCNVLHVVKDPTKLLKEAKRVLKDEGVIITSTDCYGKKDTLKAKFQYIFTIIANKIRIIPYLSWFREKDIINLIEECGFKIVDKAQFKYMGITGCYVKARK
ncbi:class I SAM-dependent methyltransferase [Crassaminicella thermophila]|uniref:Class I SAM-dependent methyltransferase n=2 Tax=Crassaminicella thermophila TaxID=2599308 RepID=A0A5C0SBX4_CRATE|nr:class I SAM-dependent methyltransferase [Crassaminicella thermophila]